MVVVKIKSNRNILAYFFESKVWKSYLADVVLNYAYWQAEDKNRAARMFTGKWRKNLGFTVEEHIYDMLACVYASKLSKYTKQRLYDEIAILEEMHDSLGNLEKDVTDG